METMIVTKILTSVFALFLSSKTMQNFITLLYYCGKKKITNDQNFQFFLFLTTLIAEGLLLDLPGCNLFDVQLVFLSIVVCLVFSCQHNISL